MGSFSSSRRRARGEQRAGRERARVVAARLGTALWSARAAAGLTQADVGARAGMSQGLISHLERGLGTSASLETWACVAAAVGEQVVAFLELGPGAAPPRDIEHLRRQSALIELAERGGWSALPELAIDPGLPRSRAIDVALVRAARLEAVAVEVWNWFDDVGAALRGLDAKVSTLRDRLHQGTLANVGGRTDWIVRGLFVVRDTRRNRMLTADLRPLFAARFRGSATAWLAALTEPGTPIPHADGLLWADGRGSLRASRLGRRE